MIVLVVTLNHRARACLWTGPEADRILRLESPYRDLGLIPILTAVIAIGTCRLGGASRPGSMSRSILRRGASPGLIPWIRFRRPTLLCELR